MKLHAINESYLNVSGHLFDSEFINLANIEDNHLHFDERTMFLTDYQKEKLNKQQIQKYERTVYIFRQKNVWGIVCNMPISNYKDGFVKNHELVIPETIQGMMSNLYGYNAEAAPVLFVHKEKVSLPEFVEVNIPDEKMEIQDMTIYIYKNITMVQKLLDMYEKIEYFYIGDGHHRTYTTSLSTIKSDLLSCIVSFEEITCLPIHRKILNVTAAEYENALKFISKKFDCKKVVCDEKVDKNYVKMIYRDECYLIRLIDLSSDAFWNNDVYRLNTQLINQAFRIFDSSSIKYISPHDLSDELSKEANNDSVIFELSELPTDEFINAAQNDTILPPKSTWMSFKFPSLLIMSKYK